jgi:hypothetical protein
MEYMDNISAYIDSQVYSSDQVLVQVMRFRLSFVDDFDHIMISSVDQGVEGSPPSGTPDIGPASRLILLWIVLVNH